MNHILICDDEIDIVNALKIYLSNPNYIIHEAYNGYEAVEKVRSEKIDLVLLDIMMPGITGIGVLKEMRNRGIETPVLLLTALGTTEDKV